MDLQSSLESDWTDLGTWVASDITRHSLLLKRSKDTHYVRVKIGSSELFHWI